MMLRLVCAGSSSWLTDARVGQSCPLMLTLFALGLIGVGSMPWQRYHAKTVGRDFRQWSKSQLMTSSLTRTFMTVLGRV